MPRWRDVRELTVESFRERTGRETVDCISGGFPCQPHSTSGMRLASADERDLWPEMRRVISEIKPRWVVAENVRGLLSSEDGRFFRGILRDFADMGFNVGWCLTSAANAGAPHIRERLGIIANSKKNNGNNGNTQKRGNDTKKTSVEHRGRTWWESEPELFRVVDGVSTELDISRNECLGNAVVPQQFYPIFKAIAELENA